MCIRTLPRRSLACLNWFAATASCRYCDKEFENEETLVQHQKAKHWKCLLCNKRLHSAPGVATHARNVSLKRYHHQHAAQQAQPSFAAPSAFRRLIYLMPCFRQLALYSCCCCLQHEVHGGRQLFSPDSHNLHFLASVFGRFTKRKSPRCQIRCRVGKTSR
jgi:hypothetical protein